MADDPGGTGSRNRNFANHGSSSIERTKLATLGLRGELLSLFFRPSELRRDDDRPFTFSSRKTGQMNGKFSGIVNGGGGNLDDIFNDWDQVETADDFGTPIPAGKYQCIWRKGELTTSRKGTPSYKMTLEVETGDHAGRKLWFDIWLTAASKTIAKRDLERLGITNPKEQLKQPIPRWLRLQVQVGLNADDSGIQRNSVIAFRVLERIQPEADSFAPAPETPPADSDVRRQIECGLKHGGRDHVE